MTDENNVTPAGETVVGFSDNGDPKNPLHYYLKVGESQNGWTVKEADREAATMTIVNQEGIEVTLKLGGDSASYLWHTLSKYYRAFSPASGSLGALFGGLRSLRERRRMQQEQAIADQARREAADKAREQQEAEERKQHEAERAEQREQLLRMQEELRKVREQREAQKSETAESEPESE